MKKQDRSMTTENIEKITSLLNELRDKSLSTDKTLMIYLTKCEEDTVSLYSVDRKTGWTVRYSLDWDTAAFIGFCLIESAIALNGKKKTKEYLDSLIERRGDITKGMRDLVKDL